MALSRRPAVVAYVAFVALVTTTTARAQTAPPPPAEPPPTTPAAEPTAEQTFKRGKNSFEYGDCAAALDVLAPLAVPGKLQDEHAQLDVHRMLGVCYALADKPLDAASAFQSLLSIDPDYEMDKFLNPPAAIEVFEQQKSAMRSLLEELRRAREKAKAGTIDMSGGVLVERNTVVKELPLAVSFMPFGLAQAANGETAKAVVVGVVQGVTLATCVTTFYWSMALASLEGSRGTPEEKAGQRAVYYSVVGTQIIAGMGFGLAYAYGTGDALWNREDRVVVQKTESKRALTPDEIKALSKVPPG